MGICLTCISNKWVTKLENFVTNFLFVTKLEKCANLKITCILLKFDSDCGSGLEFRLTKDFLGEECFITVLICQCVIIIKRALGFHQFIHVFKFYILEQTTPTALRFGHHGSESWVVLISLSCLHLLQPMLMNMHYTFSSGGAWPLSRIQLSQIQLPAVSPTSSLLTFIPHPQ